MPRCLTHQLHLQMGKPQEPEIYIGDKKLNDAQAMMLREMVDRQRAYIPPTPRPAEMQTLHEVNGLMAFSAMNRRAGLEEFRSPALDEYLRAMPEQQPGYRKGSIDLLGVPFHIEAVEVTVEYDLHVAVNPDWRDWVEEWEDKCNTALQSVTLDNRQWIIAITPYSK